jgi:hypothetical protein
MYKARYLLSDVARMLKRSEASLLRDAEAGLLRLRATSGSRTRSGSSEVYAMTFGDLSKYLGKARAHAIFGSSTTRRRLLVEEPEPKQRVAAKYKKCRVCGRLKPITEFPREASETHWLAAECSDCKRIYGL